MHAVTLGLSQPQAHQFAHPGVAAAQSPPPGAQPGAMTDPAQIQQLVQLLGAKMLPKQTAVVECPKSMVGRVIGKGGETIKALQQYTGAMIQIDQSTDPTRVTIAGSPQSLQLAVSMVNDIVRGTFKGFAMLRQIAISSTSPGLGQFGQPQPVYVQGYGFVPPSQVFNPEDALNASLLRTSPTGPLTPPMTPLRATAANNMAGNLSADALAALLGQNQGMAGGQGLPGAGQDALLTHLLGQLAQQGVPGMHPQASGMGQPAAGASTSQQDPSNPLAGADQATIQALLAQAGLMGAGQPMGLATGAAAGMSAHALPNSAAPGLPPSTSLMLSATGAPAVVSAGAGGYAPPPSPGLPASRPLSGQGSPPAGMAMPMAAGDASAGAPSSMLSALLQGAAADGAYLGTSPASSASPPTGSPAGGLSSAANPALNARRPGSDNGSPLGRYGAIGSPSGGGAFIGAAAEDALAARMAAVTTADVAAAGALPAGWAKVADPGGLVYYVNQTTQESSLTPPPNGVDA